MRKRSTPLWFLDVISVTISVLVWLLILSLAMALVGDLLDKHSDPPVHRKLTIIQQPAPLSSPELTPDTRCDVAQASLLRVGWPVLLRSADDPTEAVIVPAHWRVVRVQYAANLATVDCSRRPR